MQFYHVSARVSTIQHGFRQNTFLTFIVTTIIIEQRVPVIIRIVLYYCILARGGVGCVEGGVEFSDHNNLNHTK